MFAKSTFVVFGALRANSPVFYSCYYDDFIVLAFLFSALCWEWCYGLMSHQHLRVKVSEKQVDGLPGRRASVSFK